ncbi:MAG: hypothetical protein CMO81_00870 [Waddliaceae bacterium]|nr:hypothetical protein [Waddliaceae bacterium]
MTSPSGQIRLGGLTSGFDTESIVQQLLAVDQTRIDDLTSEMDINEAKIDTWEDVADQLKTLGETITTLRAVGSTLYDDKLATTTDSTVATATATSSAIESTYNITVTTMAQSKVANGSQKADGYTLPSAGSIIINGVTINFAGGETLSEVAALITAANYQSEDEIIATVIDNRLVLQTETMGSGATIYGTTDTSPEFVNATDDPNNILQGELGLIDGSGNLANVAQNGTDASIDINGITITRNTNTITDAIDNVTLSVTKTGSAVLDVSVDVAEIKEVVTDFVDLFNETRDFITRVREAKLDEDDEFGLFFSDSLLRGLFNDVRQLTTSGVKMGGADWDGSVTVQAAASVNATQIQLNNFTAGTGTLNEGDQFTIAGDSQIYTVYNDSSISGNAATVDIQPPLKIALSGGEAITVARRTLGDFGVDVDTSTVSGVEGVLAITDEGLLDSVLLSNVELIKNIFTRSGDTSEDTGIARRLYDWIDQQTKISVFSSTSRSIDDVKIPGLESSNERLEDQIAILEDRLAQKEAALIRQFAEMENSLAKAQSSGASLSGLAAGGGTAGG